MTLEALEARQLLAVVTWDGDAGDNSWHSPTNWDGDLVPVAGDDAIIGAAFDGTTIQFDSTTASSINSLTSAANLEFVRGTFNIDAPSQVDGDLLLSSNATTRFAGAGTLGVTGLTTIEDGADAFFDLDATLANVRVEDFGSKLSGDGTVSVTGQFDWNNRAVIEGNGSLDILPNATMTINSGPASAALTRTLNNAGTVEWASGPIGGSNATQFNNLATGTFRISANDTFGSANGVVTNDGLIERPSGTGTAVLNLNVVNNNVIDVQTGTLEFRGDDGSPPPAICQSPPERRSSSAPATRLTQ